MSSRNFLASLFILAIPFISSAQIEENNTHTFDKLNPELVDSTQPNAKTEFRDNYNAGVKYYNAGVDLILKLDKNADVDEIIATQDKAVALFKKALPFLERCQELKPNDENIKKTINGIDFIINPTDYPEKKK